MRAFLLSANNAKDTTIKLFVFIRVFCVIHGLMVILITALLMKFSVEPFYARTTWSLLTCLCAVFADMLQIILLELAVQGALADTQFFGYLGAVTVMLMQQGLDMRGFNITQ